MIQGLSAKGPALAWALALAVSWSLDLDPGARAQTPETEAEEGTESGLPAAEVAIPSPSGPGSPVVLLQGLDKITARVSTFEAPVSQTVRFGTLQITARHCQKRPPTEPPESAAFLEVLDQHPDAPPVELFTGWMFASSPALSGLEHPVYDVWVLDCLAAAGGAAEEADQ